MEGQNKLTNILFLDYIASNGHTSIINGLNSKKNMVIFPAGPIRPTHGAYRFGDVL